MLGLLERFLKERGRITRIERGRQELWGVVDGYNIYAHIEPAGWQKSRVILSARKYLWPKPAIAAGLLYQLTDQAK